MFQLYPIGYRPQGGGPHAFMHGFRIESSATHPRWGLPPKGSASGAIEESDLVGQLTRRPNVRVAGLSSSLREGGCVPNGSCELCHPSGQTSRPSDGG